jgi:hypothetical protein
MNQNFLCRGSILGHSSANSFCSWWVQCLYICLRSNWLGKDLYHGIHFLCLILCLHHKWICGSNCLLDNCFSTRVDLAYHQNQIGESTIGHFMIFSISPRVGKVLLITKLEFKWLRFIMNKFVIYYQATVLRRDILFHFSQTPQ